MTLDSETIKNLVANTTARQSQTAILTFTGAITGIVAAAVINANVKTDLSSLEEIARIKFINECILKWLLPGLLLFALLLYIFKGTGTTTQLNSCPYNLVVIVGLAIFVFFSWGAANMYNSKLPDTTDISLYKKDNFCQVSSNQKTASNSKNSIDALIVSNNDNDDLTSSDN